MGELANALVALSYWPYILGGLVLVVLGIVLFVKSRKKE